jgi:pimeloyl-ACP methyl ester carboxylesterase
MNKLPADAIKRGFVDIPDGQIHYRHCGAGGARPIVLLHASPGSAKTLEPMLRRFGATRRTIAPDTMGNGDSTPPRRPSPALPDFAAGTLAAIDALGLAEFDLYGTHTGAAIATEIAIAVPQRVRHLVLDGVSLYSDTEIAEMLARYAPEIVIDHEGRHISWIWHFVRDTYSFFPWYKRDAAHARTVGLPPPDVLHDKFVEVIKAARSYHFSYRAAIGHNKRARLPLIRVPTLVACARSDMLFKWHDEVCALVAGCAKLETDGIGSDAAADATVRAIAQFLDR